MMLQGFKNVSNMGGGYLAWVENGFPIKVEQEPVTVTVKVQEPAKVEDQKPKQEL